MRNANEAWASTSRVFRAFCIGLDTPRSLKAWLLVKYGEFEQLANFAVHPTEYCDAEAFMLDYAVVNFLKKNADLPVELDTRTPAVAAFKSSELACAATNARIEKFRSDGIIAVGVGQVIHLAQRKIASLIGNADLADLPYSWGPGASYDLSRSKAYLDEKLTKLPFTVTGSAWKQAAEMINSDFHWKEAIVAANPGYTGPIFQVIPGGRYDTVPKTVLTDRSILVEPRLNIPLQKRYGIKLRGLLKRVDVDLADQSRNQYLAEHAITLGLATLDVKGASDSVARQLVELLLPPDWYESLDAVRSRWFESEDGSWARLEKFSSMGNGFTFELESLIFWSITAAATELSGFSPNTVGIYGDDIICRKEVVPLLHEALTWAGFELNSSKSFTDGVFYESCGAHFFGGRDVTPLYQKCAPGSGFDASLFGNRILRFAARLGHHVVLDKRIRGAWECAVREYKPREDAFGPPGESGNGYWEAPASRYSARARSSSAGLVVTVASYGLVRRVIPAKDEAMLALWLRRRSYSKSLHSDEGCGLPSRPPTSEPLVSVTGTSRKKKVVCNGVEPGMIESRMRPRYSIKHRRVEIPAAAMLMDW